ncbi:hypothetical protein JB92DRAFT_1452186 [Gautieria morchelliformis]|nr:hypothetical protein JB92DRAFT_1452186 [Gautieria morchelliformis]
MAIPSAVCSFCRADNPTAYISLPTTSPMYYCFYDTVVQALDDALGPMELRLYSPPGERLLPDDTIVRVIGRIFAPPSSPILMDVISLMAYPGDPTSDEYEDGIPDDPSVAIWMVGAVLNNAEVDADPQTRAFNLAVSDYVRDGPKAFILESVSFLCLFFFHLCMAERVFLRCVYNGNSVRWSRAPAPNVNTAIYAYGTFRKVNEHGNLSIIVDNVALNVGPATLGPCSPGRAKLPPSGKDGKLRRRARKFATTVSKDDGDDTLPHKLPQDARHSSSPL